MLIFTEVIFVSVVSVIIIFNTIINIVIINTIINTIIGIENIVNIKLTCIILVLIIIIIFATIDNIVGIKRTDDVNQLITLYSFATVFFNPTYEDNYPTVNLEAIACETPVVTYNTGGSYECTGMGRFGKSINKKDYNELLHIIKQVHSRELTFDFSDLSYIAKEKMISSYLELYNNMMTSNGENNK